MRGADFSQLTLFITRTVADFVPQDHPLRALRDLHDEEIASPDGLFDTLCADLGKVSGAPEPLLDHALLPTCLLRQHVHFLSATTRASDPTELGKDR
jgi:hypothetical protein